MDLSDYIPDPVAVCIPGMHQVTYEAATNSHGEVCTVCGLNLADEDEEYTWLFDQVLQNPPSDIEEN